MNVVDDRLRLDHHDATIGLVLCASRNETVARYALSGIERPVGVARYTTGPRLVDEATSDLGRQLPELTRISDGVQKIVDRHVGSCEQAKRQIP